MRIKHLLTMAGLCLLGLAAPVLAATSPRDASAECVSCHDEEDLPDNKLGSHAPFARKPPMAAAAQQLAQRSMGDASNPRTPTCITCHGPSPTHVKKPEGVKDRPAPDRVFGKKTNLSAAERSALATRFAAIHAAYRKLAS